LMAMLSNTWCCLDQQQQKSRAALIRPIVIAVMGAAQK
jgi:hypothetical protein